MHRARSADDARPDHIALADVHERLARAYRPKWRPFTPAATALLLVLATPPEARAQETPANTTVLPPIEVTARKRPELEQNVPIGMSVIDGQQLDVPPTASNGALARSAPNANFVDLGGQSGNLFNIRGVGAFAPVSADDTSAVVYLGEIPQSVFGIPPSLLDINRVEVLRGPQGTLYGRNTQAGAINIVPNLPTFDRNVSFRTEYGTGQYGLGEMIANTPLVDDRLAGRLALRYSTFGGDIPNLVAGGNDGAKDIGAARASLLFTPNDLTSATLTFNYDHNRDTNPRFLLRGVPGFPVSALDLRTEVSGDNYNLNLKVNHDFGSVILDTVTSFQRNTSNQRLDLSDGLLFSKLTGLPFTAFNVPDADSQNIAFGENLYMQEVRLSSPQDDRVAWTAGVNFFRSEQALDSTGHSGLPNYLLTNGDQSNRLSTNSYSAFGEATVPLTERLKLTLGARLGHEDKDATYTFRGNGTPGVVPFSTQDGSLSDTFVTGRTALSYDWSPSLMTYTSIARGYATGGFPDVSVNNPFGKTEPDFPASSNWTYELGFKSKLFRDRIGLTGAVFFNDVKDGHLIVFDPANAFFTTAALDYQSYGGELEMTARVLPDFDVFGGIGYTHAELGPVPAGSLTGAKDGNRVPNVPAFTTNLGAQYTLPGERLGLRGNFLARATWQFVGSRAADVANNFDLGSYNIINAKIGWRDDRLEVYAFGTNLLDDRYEAWGQAFGPTVQSVRVGQGRIVGVGASLKF